MDMPPKVNIGLKQWAYNVSVSCARARVWAAEGRLKGAYKIGKTWIVPWDTKRPKPRKKGE